MPDHEDPPTPQVVEAGFRSRPWRYPDGGYFCAWDDWIAFAPSKRLLLSTLVNINVMVRRA